MLKCRLELFNRLLAVSKVNPLKGGYSFPCHCCPSASSSLCVACCMLNGPAICFVSKFPSNPCTPILDINLDEPVPEWFWQLSAEQCRHFIDFVIDKVGNKIFGSFETHNVVVADQWQRLCLHAGWWAKVVHNEDIYTSHCDQWKCARVCSGIPRTCALPHGSGRGLLCSAQRQGTLDGQLACRKRSGSLADSPTCRGTRPRWWIASWRDGGRVLVGTRGCIVSKGMLHGVLGQLSHQCVQEVWHDGQRQCRKRNLQLQAVQQYHALCGMPHPVFSQATVSGNSDDEYWN